MAGAPGSPGDRVYPSLEEREESSSNVDSSNDESSSEVSSSSLDSDLQAGCYEGEGLTERQMSCFESVASIGELGDAVEFVDVDGPNGEKLKSYWGIYLPKLPDEEVREQVPSVLLRMCHLHFILVDVDEEYRTYRGSVLIEPTEDMAFDLKVEKFFLNNVFEAQVTTTPRLSPERIKKRCKKLQALCFSSGGLIVKEKIQSDDHRREAFDSYLVDYLFRGDGSYQSTSRETLNRDFVIDCLYKTNYVKFGE